VSLWNDTIWLSRWLGDSFVDQKNWDIVPNRVSPAAFAALQSLSLILQNQGLLADRADKNVEQILGNHDRDSIPFDQAGKRKG